MSEPNIQEAVKQRYGEAAKRAASGGTACCGGGAELSGCDPITKDLYTDTEKGALPGTAVSASLGCGNPTALAKLQPGEVVLDLGSGGGIDVILSAKRVGPTGKAYGLDMTEEMLALARENQKKAGIENVEFLKGAIENVPLPDNSVDVVSPTASSIFPATKTAFSPKPSASSSPAAASPSPTWSFVARFLPISARAWSCGSAASPAHCKNRSTAKNSLAPASSPSISSPLAFTKWKKPADFSRAPASIPKPWARKLTANSSALLFAPPSPFQRMQPW